ncbi:hypothetical protein ERO13_A10G154250v2 [Gossypium hirsutum]|uniref:Uncharacterized protein n=1 Tax=Gossypium tomentosum TaxID=34277 RepID=A0A5D2NUP5_GOSTO|nr:hypothetical protein ERO13_A10G154250v2 [Gossypium hirsutum]TYI06804.1 hypothetical protein ES332_A10G184300v1 [Gossypium tomentosum]
MDPTSLPAVVIDNGSWYYICKIGFTGNVELSFIQPTVVAYSAGVMADLDFFIGDEALTRSRSSNNYNIIHPIKHGKVDNWDAME